MAAPNQTPAPQAGSSSSRPTASTTSQLVIPITAPAGGITITQPPQTATSFYKIAANEPVTFGWNLTSVLATPTHITVSAICDNGNTYPVGPTDGVIPGTATEVVWDVFDYQKQNPNKPLAEAGYSLTMWDDRGPNSPPRAGYMQPYSGLKFALYTPQTYTPLGAGWTCSVCSSAGTNAAHPVFVSLLVTFFLIFFSGFHLIRSSSRSIQA